jgi:hypothetical protein
VKCPEDNLLYPCHDSDFNIICTNCGAVDSSSHKNFEFLGAYCPYHKQIHYRWIEKEFGFDELNELRLRNFTDASISPSSTDNGIEKFFLKEYFWQTNEGICMAPDYIEVQFTGIEDVMILRRPTDTGYHSISSLGIYAPFLSAVFEWLYHEKEWNELLELVKVKNIAENEKSIIYKAIKQPTPTNIFQLLWTFKQYIPNWPNNRKLGRRPPSNLIIDEIRWTSGLIQDLNHKEIEKLRKSVSEDSYWASWPEIWPEEVSLNRPINEIGTELKRIGLKYTSRLQLIENPDITKNERSWKDIIVKMKNWSIKYEKGGKIDKSSSIIKSNGFFERLQEYLGASEKARNKEANSNHLKIYLPLEWNLVKEDKGCIYFKYSEELLNKEILAKTLIALKPWIEGKELLKVMIILEEKQINGQSSLVQSFQSRIENTNIFIEIVDNYDV